MRGDRNSLFFFENRFDFFIIDIFESLIVLTHNSLYAGLIPDGQVSVKFIILGQHLYFLGVLFLPVLPPHELLLVIIVVVILVVDVGWC